VHKPHKRVPISDQKERGVPGEKQKYGRREFSLAASIGGDGRERGGKGAGAASCKRRKKKGGRLTSTK